MAPPAALTYPATPQRRATLHVETVIDDPGTAAKNPDKTPNPNPE
jgi:hypothetical protein